MGKSVLMPKLGLTMTKGRIVEWRKREGESVKEGEVIAIIESEKITSEVKAPISGILLKIYVPKGSYANVGQIIAYIGEPEEKPPELVVEAVKAPKPTAPPPPEAPPPATARVAVRATPRARRIAEEKGIDLTKIVGSGPGGLITEEDVLREIEKKEKYTLSGIRVKELLPLTPIREVIAKRMVESLQTAAQVTLTIEAQIDALVKLREELLKTIEVRVTYTDILVKVVATLLKEYPLLNSVLEEDKIKILDEINIGIAVALDHGLIVPVIKNADKKHLKQIAEEAHELARKAREGLLTPDEVSRGTFTITNLGMFSIDAFTPIINPPEAAILGVGRIMKKPVVIEDSIRIGHVMWLSLTFDHRIMDGHVAAKFLQDLAQILNDENKLRKYLEL
ncbi:MAG: dihydrolipoamide acetyltransferase family protein [Nitrososphaerota archaeon]